jgi:hypothetical protein
MSQQMPNMPQQMPNMPQQMPNMPSPAAVSAIQQQQVNVEVPNEVSFALWSSADRFPAMCGRTKAINTPFHLFLLYLQVIGAIIGSRGSKIAEIR